MHLWEDRPTLNLGEPQPSKQPKHRAIPGSDVVAVESHVVGLTTPLAIFLAPFLPLAKAKINPLRYPIHVPLMSVREPDVFIDRAVAGEF
jgi:hypothetical protein